MYCQIHTHLGIRHGVHTSPLCMQQEFFLGEIFYVAWIGDHFKEDLAKSGYKLDNEVSILLINLLYLWLQIENRLYIILVIFTIFF